MNNIHNKNDSWYGLDGFKLIAQKTSEMIDINQSYYFSDDGSPLYFPLECLQLITLALGRINTHSPKKRTVILPKREIERALGKGITDDSLTRWKNILGRQIEINSWSNHTVSIFEESFFGKTEFEGKDCVKCLVLSFSEVATNYVFNVDTLGYAKIHANITSSFRSRYSFVLYDYLVKNLGLKFQKNEKEWTVSIDNLCHQMCYRYDQNFSYKKFHKGALDVAIKEINEKTNLAVTYERQLHWRRVVAVRFKVKRKANTADRVGAKIQPLSEEAIRMYLNKEDIFLLLRHHIPTISHKDAESIYDLLEKKTAITEDEPAEQFHERMISNFKQCLDKLKQCKKNPVKFLESCIDNHIINGKFNPIFSKVSYKTNPRKSGKEAGITLDPPDDECKSEPVIETEEFSDSILDMFEEDDDEDDL